MVAARERQRNSVLEQLLRTEECHGPKLGISDRTAVPFHPVESRQDIGTSRSRVATPLLGAAALQIDAGEEERTAGPVELFDRASQVLDCCSRVALPYEQRLG